MSLPEDSRTLVCCACGKNKEFSDGSMVLGSKWELEEDKDGKPFDLCPSCKKRQDGQDEKIKQMKGFPAQLIPPLKYSIKDCVEVTEEDCNNKEGMSKMINIVPNVEKKKKSNSAYQARLRFKFIGVEIYNGKELILGKKQKAEAFELNEASFQKLIKKKEYFINI